MDLWHQFLKGFYDKDGILNVALIITMIFAVSSLIVNIISLNVNRRNSRLQEAERHNSLRVALFNIEIKSYDAFLAHFTTIENSCRIIKDAAPYGDLKMADIRMEIDKISKIHGDIKVLIKNGRLMQPPEMTLYADVFDNAVINIDTAAYNVINSDPQTVTKLMSDVEDLLYSFELFIETANLLLCINDIRRSRYELGKVPELPQQALVKINESRTEYRLKLHANLIRRNDVILKSLRDKNLNILADMLEKKTESADLEAKTPADPK